MGIFAVLSASAQDWANLARYRAENEAVGLPAPGEKRVVFMGNSITEGWRKARPGFFYPHTSNIGRGISGQVTPQMLVRFRQDVVALQPSAVVILAGTNDIAGNQGPSTLEMIMDNLASMAEIAKENGIKPILCSVLPAYDYRWKPGIEPAPKIVRLNGMIRTYCTEHGIEYLDFHTAMKDSRNGLKEEYTTDMVHVTPAGYDVMTRLVNEAIERVLQ